MTTRGVTWYRRALSKRYRYIPKKRLLFLDILRGERAFVESLQKAGAPASGGDGGEGSVKCMKMPKGESLNYLVSC